MSSDSQSKAVDEIGHSRGSWVEVGRRGKDLKVVDAGKREREREREDGGGGAVRGGSREGTKGHDSDE